MSDSIPVIGITAGDPAGVGPEIAAKAIADRTWNSTLRPVVIGDVAIFEEVVAGCGLDLNVRRISDVGDASEDANVLDVLDCGVVDDVVHGKIDERHGKAALRYIETACDLVREGRVDGMVTGPISKEAIWAAGSRFLGHTEMLANLLGVPEDHAVTMFVIDRLRIFFLTRHLSLLDAVHQLEIDDIVRFLGRVDTLIRTLDVEGKPHLALAALNPHGGENGKLGTEEQEILAPAVEKAVEKGLDVVGPIPADAVFHQARYGAYDGVIALHHDQGHIAAKTLDFFGTVACQLGLPVIRATVDHGTAFDIAGQWVANAGGQVKAMEVAAKLAPRILATRDGADRIT